MNKSSYNPEIHHRQSIRLKGHYYAGGGLYFITICAHRDAGNIFAPPAVMAMVGRVWESIGASLVGAQSSGEGNLVAAEQRNRFVIESADELWLPHITRGGMLDRLLAVRKPA